MKIGELFGASVICDIHIPHDQIWISPKEEKLFQKLMEFEAMLKNIKETQDKMGEFKLLLVNPEAEKVDE